jgi:site-specific DNA recombinase
VPTLYDDGGFSGGTLDRPALKLLLSDIAEGRVDVVVVYKIDRLRKARNPSTFNSMTLRSSTSAPGCA